MSINPKDLPEVKREKINTVKREEFEVTDDKGKKHEVGQESFTEKEIDSVHLIKIAPMFYFCTDNNKIFMIPFTVQFSAAEFMQQIARMSYGLEGMLNDIQAKKAAKDKKPTK